MFNYKLLRTLIKAGIDLKQPVNANYLNPTQSKRMLDPISFFTETAGEQEDRDPSIAKEFEDLADLADQVRRKQAHPKVQTPLRKAMEGGTAEAEVSPKQHTVG